MGIHSLLREAGGMEVLARRFSEAVSGEVIRTLAPDVIIFDDDDFNSHSAMPVSSLLLEGPPHMKVVGVSSKNDLVEVHEGHHVGDISLGDLVEDLTRNHIPRPEEQKARGGTPK